MRDDSDSVHELEMDSMLKTKMDTVTLTGGTHKAERERRLARELGCGSGWHAERKTEMGRGKVELGREKVGRGREELGREKEKRPKGKKEFDPKENLEKEEDFLI